MLYFICFQVHLTLSETETIWMLDFPGTCVAEDNEIAESVKEKNQRYEEVYLKIYTRIEYVCVTNRCLLIL